MVFVAGFMQAWRHCIKLGRAGGMDRAGYCRPLLVCLGFLS